MSEAAEKLDSDSDIELVLLASANAIQRLIAERNALRSRVDHLERELTRLRDQSTLVYDSYRRLTTEFVTQFQLIDSAIGDLFREPIESAGTRPQPAGEAAPMPLQNSA